VAVSEDDRATDDATLFDYADDPVDGGEGGDRTADAPGTDAGAVADPTTVADLDREAKLALGVELLEHLEVGEAPLAAVIDRLETITTNPTLTREILDRAETQGVVERDGARIRTRSGGTFVRFESQVVRREGEFDCRRCGASITTGHFVRFRAGELGPFGSSCVRRVTGRD
jgi:hypothetical protein